MLQLVFLFALAAQEPTVTQLLDQARDAFRSGDKATAREKMDEARPLIDRDTEALRSRIAAHVHWDDCVKTNASRVASQDEKADVLADAVLGMCLEDEIQVRALQTEVDRDINGVDGDELSAQVAKDLTEWRNLQRETALGIIVNARSKHSM